MLCFQSKILILQCRQCIDSAVFSMKSDYGQEQSVSFNSCSLIVR